MNKIFIHHSMCPRKRVNNSRLCWQSSPTPWIEMDCEVSTSFTEDFDEITDQGLLVIAANYLEGCGDAQWASSVPTLCERVCGDSSDDVSPIPLLLST
jgi:hypothetical protein